MACAAGIGSREMNLSKPRSKNEFPICDVCNKPVERLVWTHDHVMCRRVVIAFCHGEREESYIDEIEIHDDRVLGFGRAFTMKRFMP